MEKLPHTAKPLRHEIKIIDGYIVTPRGQSRTERHVHLWIFGRCADSQGATKAVYFTL